MRRTCCLLPAACCLLLAAVILLGPGGASGQQILQYGFEARGPVWKPGSSDTTSKVLKHELTDETAHTGQRCEHIQIQVEKGSYIHYNFDLPRAPITDELSVSLYLKSNRPGIQLLCRVVLPQEKDPANLAQPMTILVRCEPYQSTRWKPVILRQPVKRLREQQQLLTHKLGRDIVTAGAYIDQLVLNVYDGPGLTDVWIDDLEVGPVLENKTIAPTPKAGPLGGVIGEPAGRRSGEVELRGNQLLVSGKRFLMLGIRHTGTPLKTLREAGFNTVWLDEATPPGLVEDAVNLGFWIVPSIHRQTTVVAGPGQVAGQLTSGDVFAQKVSQFQGDAVLAWDLGTNLDAETFTDVTRFARVFRNADLQQPVIADVRDGYKGYALGLDPMMLGTHRWPLMTSMELPQYYRWLVMRRQLSLENYGWTWIQTHLPDWYAELMGQNPEKTDADEMLGPQPEQIRLLTYTAVAAGYRGLAFWSDRSLADSHQGRDRLLALALLNQELRMLEPVLVQANGPPEWVAAAKTTDVQAAVFRTPAGILVLPIWLGRGSQFVPAQSASASLVLTIPGVPITATAWEVSPGRLQSYPMQRVAGGAQINLHNFSLTSALLLTSDLSPTGMVVRLQDKQRNLAPLAAQWLHDQAQEELTKVQRVQTALERQGHSVPDAQALLAKARQALDLCMQHRRNGEHTAAYNQAEVALRALRTLMRADWDKAVRDLDTPVSSPYAISFFTLPRHWQLLDELHHMRATKTLLADGGFEVPANQLQNGWIVQEVPSLDPVTMRVCRATENPHTGRQCLMMRISPKDPKQVPESLERTYVALHSPAVQATPGSLVRISVWVRIPAGLRGSTDGAMIYDSIGGEPLAVRLTEPTKTKGKGLGWQRYSFYRRVPTSGTVSVTLALSGMGTVFFDDVSVEPLVQVGQAR